MARRHREILDTLLERIVDGRYPVGSLLPKEESISEEFDVSRGTGREALRALEERRVAVVRHGRGAIVQPPEAWNVLDPVVAAALSRGRRRRKFLEEVEELRGALRAEAAGLAAARATARQRETLGTGGDGDTWTLVVEAAQNRPLAAALRTLAELAPAAADRGSPELAAAVAGGDVDAARAAARRG